MYRLHRLLRLLPVLQGLLHLLHFPLLFHMHSGLQGALPLMLQFLSALLRGHLHISLLRPVHLLQLYCTQPAHHHKPPERHLRLLPLLLLLFLLLLLLLLPCQLPAVRPPYCLPLKLPRELPRFLFLLVKLSLCCFISCLGVA